MSTSMQKLRFFDCSTSFGPSSIKPPFTFHTRQELLERMDRYGISTALTHHAYARELSPSDGNARLMEEIAGESRLSPLWVVMPHHTDEFPHPKELLRAMDRENVRAVTMFPGTASYGFSMAEWNSGELLSALEERTVPLFLSLAVIDGGFDTVYSVLEKHPRLPLVLCGVTYRNARNLFPLLKRFDNLFVESFGYKPQDGIVDFCKRFGAERMLFGSGMPVNSGAAAVAMITYAGITDREKQLIAAENLERLLGGAKL